MPDSRNRKRPIQVKFFVDETEQALIKKKTELAGIERVSSYNRQHRPAEASPCPAHPPLR